jgi:hypothetical protein
MNTMTDHPQKQRFALHRDDAIRRHFEKLSGMIFVSEYRWMWNVANGAADVAVEPDGAVRVELPVPEPKSVVVAMEGNHALPGNLRFAGAGASMLVADSLVDGHVHLPRSFAELEAGMTLALGGEETPPNGEPLAHEIVAAAIDGGQWREGEIVELPKGWELRPRVRGRVTAVTAMIENSELRIHRRIVAAQNESSNYACLCAQALRFNEQLRHARLALRDRELVAESRLNSEQIAPQWIETAVWAVAVACRHTEDILGILADDDRVAELYADVFSDAQK